MNKLRRTLLKGAGAGGALAAALAAGVLQPGQALAAGGDQTAFDAKDLAGALKGLNVTATAESHDLLLRAPDIAENGAVVPVDVISNIPNTSSISVLVQNNPFPLSAHFEFSNGAQPDISVRLKLAKTSIVKVVAKADGKFYSAQKEVKVTAGGCGG
ncbi:MAG TPA: thiosulfate oxidation carrier protein SoxY [Rhodocyclaceae bacterium]|nr:thiosulfate oxidation carrier protein SoxY [Rhodocyclaceae bacterium]